jgi:hypothetical protein
MRLLGRRVRTAGLVLALMVAGHARVRAQEVPAVPIDCGPFRVGAGDLVQVNVGNTGPAGQEAVTLRASLLDQDGAALGEQTITLGPGQSRSVSVTLLRTGLVRGQVTPLSGPDMPQLRATLQATRQSRLRLTYGPIVECAGPTGSRGPV